MSVSMYQLDFPGLLHRYFSLSGNVSIPGLGTLTLVRTAAANDFIGRRMLPPSRTLKFNPVNDQVMDDQTNYLARISGKEKEVVVTGLKKLGQELQHRLEMERTLEWKDLGTFSISEEGVIEFVSKTSIQFFSPVEYVHVIRNNAAHSILVGDGESTSKAMEEFFDEQRANTGKNLWHKAALMLLILAALLLLSRFMVGSFDFLESRYNPLKINTPASSYRVI